MMVFLLIGIERYWDSSHRNNVPEMSSSESSQDFSDFNDSYKTDEVLMSACKAQLERNSEKIWAENNIYLPHTRKLKPNSFNEKYTWHIALTNETKNITEYYKLYRDEDIGFDGFCQKLIKDSVRIICM